MVGARISSALAAVLLLAAAADAAVTLSLKDNMRLPFEYAGKELSGDKTYAVDEGVAEKNAFLGPYVFVVGENSLLQVVDTTEYKTAESKIVAIFDIGRPGTDVATCSTLSEDLLAVATQGAGGKQSAGIVHIFSVNMTTGGVTHLRQVSTKGSLPDQIKWMNSCKGIVAAIEGEAGPSGSSGFSNPEGGVAVLTFAEGKVADDKTDFKFYSFADAGYNDPEKRDPLLEAGVRWSLRPETKDLGLAEDNKLGITIPESMTTFTKDLEPEYLALSSDGKTVYVSMQEACAVAIFDLETMEFKDIKPLQHKSWGSTSGGLDASNKDDGINMKQWDIYGMLMPDTIAAYTASDGEEYLVTANEGDDKEYIWGDDDESVWTEMTRGEDLAGKLASDADTTVTNDDLNNTAALGRIKIGTFDGYDFDKKTYSKIYTMSGRSFSIISTKTFETVYDSGSTLEKTIATSYKSIFNSEAEKDTPQTEQMDGRSDDKGLEVESLTIGQVCGKTILFVGAERTSTIFLFDITNPKGVRLESHIQAGGMNIAPEKAVQDASRPNKALGMIDPEMMSFDADRKVLIVSGSFSGTLGVYDVVCGAGSRAGAPMASFSLLVSMVAVSLASLMHFA